jgi:hypothetical protein
MTVRLSNDDRCAVDLLLEHASPGTQEINSCFTTAPSASVQQRLDRVEKFLHVLDLHSAAEPAVDLVERTMARCENRASVPANAPPTRPVAATR